MANCIYSPVLHSPSTNRIKAIWMKSGCSLELNNNIYNFPAQMNVWWGLRMLFWWLGHDFGSLRTGWKKNDNKCMIETIKSFWQRLTDWLDSSLRIGIFIIFFFRFARHQFGNLWSPQVKMVGLVVGEIWFYCYLWRRRKIKFRIVGMDEGKLEKCHCFEWRKLK